MLRVLLVNAFYGNDVLHRVVIISRLTWTDRPRFVLNPLFMSPIVDLFIIDYITLFLVIV